MHKILLTTFSLAILWGCASAPVPVDENSFSFGNRTYNQASACTVKAVIAAGFTLENPKKTGQIRGSLIPKDVIDGNKFVGTFTLDEKTKTVNARIEKHLGSNLGLMFDNKDEIDVLLNKFQDSYESCL